MHDPHTISLRSLKFEFAPGEYVKQVALATTIERELWARWAFVDLYVPVDRAAPLQSLCMQLGTGAPGGELVATTGRFTLVASSNIQLVAGGMVQWVAPGDTALAMVETSIAATDLQYLFHTRQHDVMPFTMATAIITIQPPASRDLTIACTYGLHQECAS